MKKIRFICIILIVLFCVGAMTGCSDQTGLASPANERVETGDGETTASFPINLHLENRSSIGYTTKELKIDGPIVGWFPQSVLCNGKIWTQGYGTTEAGIFSNAIICSNIDDSSAKTVWLSWPQISQEHQSALGKDEYAEWTCTSLVDCGTETPHLLLKLEKNTTNDLKTSQENITTESVTLEWNLSYLHADGTVEAGVVLAVNEYMQNNIYVRYAQGDLVWLLVTTLDNSTPSRVVACSLVDGSIQYNIEMPEGMIPRDITVTENNELMIIAKSVSSGSATTAFYVADLSSKPTQINQTYISNNFRSCPYFVRWQYGNQPKPVYLYDIDGIYFWDFDSNTIDGRYDINVNTLKDHLLVWPLLGVDTENFAIAYKNSGEPAQATTFSTQLTVDINDRTVVRLANNGNPAVTDAATTFNNSQDAIYIDVLDYSDAAATAKGFASGTEMLQRTLVQGEHIDIIVVPNDFAGGLLNPVLFRDMYPLLDADPELQRSDMVAGILRACEKEGVLPTIVPQYNLLTVVGSSEMLGDSSGWTWVEYDLASADTPVPLYGFDRTTVLHYLVQMGGKNLLDYDTSTAHLDSQQFVQLLTRTQNYPETIVAYNSEDPKSQFTEAKSLAAIRFLSDFSHIREDVYIFDGPIVYKGFPSDTGGSGSAFAVGLRLGITAECEAVDAAWQFVRQFLLPSYQDAIKGNFPIRYDSLQKLAEKARQPLKAPALPVYFQESAFTEKQLDYWKRGLTEAETDALVELIEQTDTLYRYDGTVLAILQEEVEAFYHGQVTAQEAARRMQNRVQTYLTEQN